ncbi:MAG: FAD-dependent oxidoreductase, partial [Rhodospirillales bacterium]|nr:FAD-dependent oxidoreductase [Rhodospirillales bacterium]
MTNGTAKRNIYIFGGGMAGLAAAVRSHHLGCHPILLEATGHAGGRCRSLHDDRLEQTIDNGTHLILGGNRGIFSYLDDIGASGSLTPMAGARFPFVDLKSGLKWTVRPSAGKLPWWLLVPGRRVPGGKVSDYLALARLARASGDGALTDYIKSGTPMFERFWQPLARAVLNTEAEEASAALLGAMISETLLKGGEASRPYLASAGLSAALVDPGARFLDHIGAPVQFSQRIKSINAEGGWVKSFTTEGGETTLQGGDAVICALPPVEAQRLMPDLTTPTRFNAIVNAHFRME